MKLALLDQIQIKYLENSELYAEHFKVWATGPAKDVWWKKEIEKNVMTLSFKQVDHVAELFSAKH